VRRRGLGNRASRAVFCLAWCSVSLAGGVEKPLPASQPPSVPVAVPPVPEISIQAPEPRYVAPTLRDHIGRIWAPVLINGKGPFRLVLDTGANHSAVTATVAQALGIPLDDSTSFQLQGVTGSALVPSIRIDNLLVGDLMMRSAVLPIVPDALGGAEGVLGTEGLLDKRIFIDFRHDRITITRSHNRRAPYGWVTIPVKISDQNLLITTARVASMRVTAIIDTGAQSSIANLVLRQELQRHRSRYVFTDDEITGATDDVTKGQDAAFPPIGLGQVSIQGAHITTGDLEIFGAWKLTSEPAILIGMDALGTLDELIIDYRRRELQILVRHEGITSTREYE
jgi:predicted aspartyl protease